MTVQTEQVYHGQESAEIAVSHYSNIVCQALADRVPILPGQVLVGCGMLSSISSLGMMMVLGVCTISPTK